MQQRSIDRVDDDDDDVRKFVALGEVPICPGRSVRLGRKLFCGFAFLEQGQSARPAILFNNESILSETSYWSSVAIRHNERDEHQLGVSADGIGTFRLIGRLLRGSTGNPKNKRGGREQNTHGGTFFHEKISDKSTNLRRVCKTGVAG